MLPSYDLGMAKNRETQIDNSTADENYSVDIRLFGEALREFISHHQTTNWEKTS